MSYLNYLLMGCFGQTGENVNEGQGSNWYVIVIYIVIFVVFIYFIMVRPQRKQKQKQQDTMNQMEPGDSVLTTSGFYGTIVSVTPDTVIVEFGNNKNCRIPMSKQAISQLEKANSANQATGGGQPASRKKFFEKAEETAENTAEQAEETVAEVAEDVKDTAADAVEEVKEAAADAAEEIKE